MSNSKYIIIILLMLGSSANAQKAPRVKFNSYISGGLLAGSQFKQRVQAVSGVRWRSFFFGAGVGYEDYVHRSVPIFFSVRKHFSSKRSELFLYGDIGDHVLIGPGDYRHASGKLRSLHPGIYLEGGAGLLLNIGGWKHVFFSMGNSFKRVDEVESSIGSNGTPEISRYRYTYGRLTASLGLMF